MGTVDKEYLPSDWNSDTKFWNIDGAGGDILVHKGFLKIHSFD